MPGMASTDREAGGVLCVGRVYCDLVFSDLPAMPEPGREVFAGALDLRAGGGAYITAAYLAALGRLSALCACLPAAPFDAPVMAEARANGVTLDASVPGTGAPQITVAMATGGDRAFLTRRSGTALPEDWRAALARPGLVHLHVGEATTLLEHPDLIGAARAAGLTISLDCGWDDAAFDDPRLPGLIAAVDLFLPNESEAARLAPLGPTGGLAPLVVVKRGADGAEAHMRGDVQRAPARPARVVDTTGAGDAFNAGFLHGWLAGAAGRGGAGGGPDTGHCLRLGALCGAVAVARPGGAGKLPPLRDMARATVRDAAE